MRGLVACVRASVSLCVYFGVPVNIACSNAPTWQHRAGRAEPVALRDRVHARRTAVRVVAVIASCGGGNPVVEAKFNKAQQEKQGIL